MRLGGFDRTILATEWKRRRVCADCVWLLRFEDPAPSLDELREHVGQRVPGMPPLTSVLRYPALRLGAASLVPDPEFDLSRRVLAVPPQFDDEAGWRQFIAEEIGSSIAGQRPLWSLHLAQGEGAFALILRHHHCLADGKSGLLILRTLLGEEVPEPAPLPPSPPVGLRPRDLKHLGAAALRWLRGPRPPRLRELNGPLGERRQVASMAMPIEEVKALAAATDCFPNEIYLALVAGALRRHLARRGVAVDRLPELQIGTMVDVGGRRDRRRLGNHYAAVRMPLNVSIGDPRRRAERVREAVAALHRGPEVEESRVLVAAMGRAPAPLVHAVGWVMTTTRATVNGIASHLAGGRGLTFRGEQPVRLCSWTYLPAGHSLGFVAQLMPREMTVNVMADAGLVPDLSALVEDLEASRRELLEAYAKGGDLSVAI